MKSVPAAKMILVQAEAGLRDLMASDLADKRYGDLAELASMADGLAKLCMIGAKSSLSAPAVIDRIEEEPQSGLVEKQTIQKRTASKKRKSKSKIGYPRFEFRNDSIVKIGWSKKGRKEYEHSAPVSAAHNLASHIKASTHAGRIWTVDDLGDVEVAGGENELPSYQLYLLIAWMRTIGILSKQGRSGYVVSSGAAVIRDVKMAISDSRVE